MRTSAKKETGRKLKLHRETLQRLDDASLRQALGGIFPKKPIYQTNTCACTFTCAGCLGGP